jgi:LCP family protein required for cell wall assembly
MTQQRDAHQHAGRPGSGRLISMRALEAGGEPAGQAPGVIAKPGQLGAGGDGGRTGSAGRAAPAWRTLLVALLCLAAASGWLVAEARRGHAQQAPAGVVTRAASGAAGPSFGRRLTFLVIGSDAGSRRFDRPGPADRGRADSIHLVVIDPRTRKGTVIGFPRDSYVPIPGRGRNKINAAMVFGGPPLLARTIEQLGAPKIDYVVLTSFDGLIEMVDDVGKVRVNVPRAVVDEVAGANLRAGVQELSGSQALALSRARKSLPGGDFTRSEHQGLVLLGGLGTFQTQMRGNPAELMRWLATAREHVEADLPVGELLRLALLARTVPPRNLKDVVLPGRAGDGGGASVVILDPEARRILARAKAGRF